MSVKVRKRGRPSAKDTQLTAVRIVSVARALLQADGKIPSIRKLASVLEVDPMAIYHYFSNKAALLEAVTASLMDELVFPEGGYGWPAQVQTLCRSYLELLSRYQGLLEIMLSMPCGGPAELFSKRMSIALEPLNLSEEKFRQALNLIVDYLHGVAFAMKYNSDEALINQIDGPLELIFTGLQRELDVLHD